MILPDWRTILTLVPNHPEAVARLTGRGDLPALAQWQMVDVQAELNPNSAPVSPSQDTPATSIFHGPATQRATFVSALISDGPLDVSRYFTAVRSGLVHVGTLLLSMTHH